MKKVTTEELRVKTRARFGTPENPQGITIYDKVTGEPVCVESENKTLVLKEGECVSP